MAYYVILEGGEIRPKPVLEGGEIYPGGSSGGGGGQTQIKSVSYTPTETAISASVLPDTGYTLSKVNVSVGAISSTYVGSAIPQNDSSDLSASGATVTAPAGYYASSASKAIANASISDGGIAYDPSTNTMECALTVNTPGYVSSGWTITEGDALSQKAAATYHPSTSDQTIAANQYLTGAQTIKGVLLTNLSAGNIKKDVVVKIGDSADDDRIVSVTGTYEGGGGGTPQILWTNGTTSGTTVLYSEDTVIGDDVAAYTLKKLTGAPYLKTLTVMRTGDYGGNSYQIQSSFKNCPLLEEVTFYNGCHSSGYCEDMVDDCPNLKSFTFGAIGYPNTVGMGPTSGQYKLFRNVTVAFDIIIYTTATSLATVPSNLTTASPWGATNATVIYKNSVTGEVLE